MIDKALMASAGMIGRVRQEVTIHSRLKHPAILELYTFFEDMHYVYLVLELAHNGELAKHFKLGTRGLSEKAAADILKQVLSGVLYLHTHNIIHRDLSLNNLLLTKDLIVKIADFGLATQLNGPDEKHVTMCGTPNYISPEVASREVHGLPADVWGLGCMLFTLLVGSPPFHTQHVKTTLNKVINADYKIPSELSLEAQDLLQRLLCKDPTKRITLKGIIEHPFLSYNVQKQEFSRDSGFLTTMHSTQHSSKLKAEEILNVDYLHGCKDHNIAKDFKPTSFNVLNGIQENSNVYQNQEERHNRNFNVEPVFTEVIPNVNTNTNMYLKKYDSACSSNSDLLENIKQLDIRTEAPRKNPSINSHDENKTKSCNVNTNMLNVPPLCANRLPTISHRTRNAILKIEPNAVVVEFLKKTGKNREEKVMEICKISKDGMKIIIFSVDKNNKKNIDINRDPNPDEVFSYHNLPQKHWKKYLYASRFVDLVKAKTPKITLYTSLAKCQLMENGTDFELFFYNGEKVTSTLNEGIKIIDKFSKIHHNGASVPDLKYVLEHFEECSNRIKRIQTALSCISDECYPLIIGKRPIQTVNNVLSPKHSSVNVDYNTPVLNIGSFHRTIASSCQAQSDIGILKNM
ncbi:serine/threonine-protein kinase PLK4 [Manduca sexta]|nr:serine/threonine-protein kinase PLK4 [Manduca sexta]